MTTMYSMTRLALLFTLCAGLAKPRTLIAQALLPPAASALPPAMLLASAETTASPAFSSSQPLIPEASTSPVLAREVQDRKPAVILNDSIRPFSTAAIELSIGVSGIGGDIAVPLSRRFNLRAGGSFFPLDLTVTEDGVDLNGSIRLAGARAHLDFFPWAGAFRISPGITLYNDNHATATAMVAAGTSFTLNDTTYISGRNDPIHGTGSLTLGRSVAPNITVGFGNMIPRSNKHISFPFEVGVEFVGRPTVALNLQGTSCDVNNNCGNIATDAPTQANLRAEEKTLADDLHLLEFSPIVSLGFSYKF